MNRRPKLGLKYNVTNFNISPKKRLQDPLKLLVNGSEVNKSVQSWIDNDCITLYSAIYENNEGVSLTRDAIFLLKAKLQSEYPDIAIALQRRKNEWNNHRRLSKPQTIN